MKKIILILLLLPMFSFSQNVDSLEEDLKQSTYIFHSLFQINRKLKVSDSLSLSRELRVLEFPKSTSNILRRIYDQSKDSTNSIRMMEIQNGILVVENYLKGLIHEKKYQSSN